MRLCNEIFNNCMEKKLKIFIGVLAVVAVILVGVLIYVWYDRNSLIDGLTIEKGQLTQEMEQLKMDYSTLSTTNDTLNQQLMLEKEKVDQLIERVKQTESSNKIKLLKYERELGTLRSIMRGYIKQIDSLNTLNISLRNETAAAKKEAKAAIAKYDDIKSTTEEYAKQVEKGSIVRGRGLTMVGVNSTGKDTDRSSRIEKLKACLNLIENSIAKRGPKTVYIRVKGPDGILMTTGQQNVFTCDGEQMIYSAAREVDYQGNEVEVCIYYSGNTKFTRGTYTVDAYTNDGKIGSAETYIR